MGALECPWDELLAENLVELAVAVITIVEDCLVDYIIALDASAVASHDGCDMVAHTSLELLCRYLLAVFVGEEPWRAL